MRLTVKLYAGLSDYLPPAAQDHAVDVDVPVGATAHAVIDRFNVPRQSAHLVLRNGTYLNPAERDRIALCDGDVLAIWPPVAGGAA